MNFFISSVKAYYVRTLRSISLTYSIVRKHRVHNDIETAIVDLGRRDR